MKFLKNLFLLLLVLPALVQAAPTVAGSTGSSGGGGGTADSTAALQTAGNSSLSSIDGKTPSLGQGTMSASQPVVIASNQSAVPVSASALPLPTGAATSAKQPALGTAGSPSTDVISIQGVASGTTIPTTESRLPSALGQGAASGALLVAMANEQVQDAFITGQSAQSASGNNILLATAGTGSTDTVTTISYRSFYTQIIGSAGIASGQVTFEGSNDNTTFNPVTVYDDALVTGVPINAAFSVAASTSRFFSGKVTYKFLRCRISTVFSGGTVQAITRLSPTDYVPRVLTVSQATAANLNATVSATNLSSNMAQVGGTTVVTGGVAGMPAVGGNVAISAAATANPVGVGGRVTTTLDTSLVQGDVAALNLTAAGQVIYKAYGDASNDWNYATPIASPITNTTAVVFKAAGAASIRNYVTGLQMINTSATASIVTIQDGATVIWTGYLPASMTSMVTVNFPTPLRGTAATAMNFVVNTTATSTLVSAQGYQSF